MFCFIFQEHKIRFMICEYINIEIYQVVQRFGFRPISSTTSKQQPETFELFFRIWNCVY